MHVNDAYDRTAHSSDRQEGNADRLDDDAGTAAHKMAQATFDDAATAAGDAGDAGESGAPGAQRAESPRAQDAHDTSRPTVAAVAALAEAHEVEPGNSLANCTDMEGDEKDSGKETLSA
jgi:hypothetical protein